MVVEKIGSSEGGNPAYFPDNEKNNPHEVEKVESIPKIRKDQDEYDKDGIGKNPFPTYNKRGKMEQSVSDKDSESEKNIEDEK